MFFPLLFRTAFDIWLLITFQMSANVLFVLKLNPTQDCVYAMESSLSLMTKTKENSQDRLIV